MSDDDKTSNGIRIISQENTTDEIKIISQENMRDLKRKDDDKIFINKLGHEVIKLIGENISALKIRYDNGENITEEEKDALNSHFGLANPLKLFDILTIDDIKGLIYRSNDPLLDIYCGYREYRNNRSWDCDFCGGKIDIGEGYWSRKYTSWSEGHKLCNKCFLKFLLAIEDNRCIKNLFETINRLHKYYMNRTVESEPLTVSKGLDLEKNSSLFGAFLSYPLSGEKWYIFSPPKEEFHKYGWDHPTKVSVKVTADEIILKKINLENIK